MPAEEFQAAFDRPILGGFLREAVPDARWQPGASRGATRYDKLARNYLAGVFIAATCAYWLN